MSDALLRAAVLGSPISHSLSPVLHRAAYAQLGLSTWEYEAVECDEQRFPSVFADLRGDRRWAGLSLTMPLKRTVLPLLDEVGELAAAVGAVNTVVLPSAPGAVSPGIRGENTDVHGIVAALAEIGVGAATDAVVLGGGATAASAVAALVRLGCARPVLLVRSPERARPVVDAGARLGATVRVDLLSQAPRMLGGDVWVSTLPGTAGDGVAASIASSDDPLPPLMDVTYHPWPTGLGALWQRRGAPVVGGLSMLVHQAAEQVRLMTGHRPDPEGMRAAALAEIRRRG